MSKIKKIFIAIITLICTSCVQQRYYFEDRGIIFNTVYTIKYESNDLYTKKIQAELQAFNLSLNVFYPNSIVSKVNRNEDVEVDDWFITVFNKAQEVSEKTGGVFDVTVAPLINLWGFGFEKADSVSQEIIDSIKLFVGYKKIRIENRKIIKDDPRVTLNFSAIAKGYACDVIAVLLEKEGVTNYMIDIGGEVVAKGKNPNGLCWHIGINKPEDEFVGMTNDTEDTVLLCTKKGLATSGNYRNFYIKDGVKYSHTIDPRTGYPSENEHDILSVTIVASDCMTADAYATAFMAMGMKAACRLAETIPEIEYYILCPGDLTYTYQKKYSNGMKSLMKR